MTEFTAEDIEHYRKQYAIWTSRRQTTPEELLLIDRLRDALDEIEHLQARVGELEEQQRWIPVEEKLPEETGYYTIAWQSNWGKGELYSGYEFFKLGEEWDRANIKYWQPLPKPPGSEEE